MKHLPLSGAEPAQGRLSGLVISVGLHVVVGALLLTLKIAPVEELKEWVEMRVAATPPPPPPPPPAPEPEKAKPRKVAVALPRTPPEPDPTPPPPEAPTQAVRRVQGLNANSFLPGGNSGLSVRAGTSLSTKAGPESMGVDEAGISWAAASVAPRCPKPALETPKGVKAAGIQGKVELLLDVGVDGAVTSVVVTRSLSADADAACVAAWQGVRCTPGKRGEDRVAITGLPHSCTFKVIE